VHAYSFYRFVRLSRVLAVCSLFLLTSRIKLTCSSINFSFAAESMPAVGDDMVREGKRGKGEFTTLEICGSLRKSSARCEQQRGIDSLFSVSGSHKTSATHELRVILAIEHSQSTYPACTHTIARCWFHTINIYANNRLRLSASLAIETSVPSSIISISIQEKLITLITLSHTWSSNHIYCKTIFHREQ
jgi:hypothetical protein